MNRRSTMSALEAAIDDAGYAGRTRRAYLRWAAAFLRETPGRAPCPDAAQRFLDKLSRSDAAPGTLRQARSALGFLLEMAAGARTELTVPSKQGAWRPAPARVLPPETAEAIVQECRGSARIAAALIYGSGLSAREAAALTVGAVDLAERTVKAGGRTAPLSDAATLLLAKHLRELQVRFTRLAAPSQEWKEQPLLPSLWSRARPEKGLVWRPLTDETLQRHIGRAFLRLRLDPARACSTLQNSFARAQLDGGTNPDQVLTWLGRRSDETLRRIQDADLKGAAA